MESYDEPVMEKGPEVPAPDPNAVLADLMESLLAPMQQQLADLAADNKTIKAENEELRQKVAEVEATPQHIQGADFTPDPRAARSVVISTRPVQDNPELYASKGIVDPGGLSVNTASPLSGKNR